MTSNDVKWNKMISFRVEALVSDHFWVYGDYKKKTKYNRLQNKLTYNVNKMPSNIQWMFQVCDCCYGQQRPFPTTFIGHQWATRGLQWATGVRFEPIQLRIESVAG